MHPLFRVCFVFYNQLTSIDYLDILWVFTFLMYLETIKHNCIVSKYITEITIKNDDDEDDDEDDEHFSDIPIFLAPPPSLYTHIK